MVSHVYQTKGKAIADWEEKREAIERAREIRYQPAVKAADGDSDDDELAPYVHSADDPGLAAVVRGVVPSIPAMPVIVAGSAPHREKSQAAYLLGHLALVTRNSGPAEMKLIPEAAERVDEDWESLLPSTRGTKAESASMGRLVTGP